MFKSRINAIKSRYLIKHSIHPPKLAAPNLLQSLSLLLLPYDHAHSRPYNHVVQPGRLQHVQLLLELLIKPRLLVLRGQQLRPVAREIFHNEAPNSRIEQLQHA